MTRNTPLTGNQVEILPKGFHPTIFPNRAARRSYLNQPKGNNRKATRGRRVQYIHEVVLASYGTSGMQIIEIPSGKTKLIRHTNPFR